MVVESQKRQRSTKRYKATYIKQRTARHSVPKAQLDVRSEVVQTVVCRAKKYFTKKRVLQIALAIAGIAILVNLWLSRPLSINVSNQVQEVPANASLLYVYEMYATPVEPGDLVDVTGEVIQAGAGAVFSAIVDGQVLDENAANAYHLQPNDVIEFKDGTNTIEPYAVSDTSQVAPQLVMDGDHGSVAYVSQWGYPGVSEHRIGQRSHKEADVVCEQPTNCVVSVRNIEPPEGSKLVALTFDDGPSSFTPSYLDILQQYGAHATFFELGLQIEKDGAGCDLVRDSGNGMGTHTYGHKFLTRLSAQDLQDQLRWGLDELEQHGVYTTMLRPPYGDFDAQTWLDSAGIISSSITWTQDSQDWSLPGASAVVEHALSNIKSGSIILMHDGGGDRQQDIEALPQIISTLQNEGYRVVSVQELLASDPSIPADVAAGTASMPQGAMWPTSLAQ